MKGARLLAILGCGAVLSLAPGVTRADAENEGTFWTGYMSSWWIDPSWAVWFDTHYNIDTFFVLRGGLTYRFDAGPSITGGYGWLLLNPDLQRQEHRPWGQVFLPYRLNDDWSLSGRSGWTSASSRASSTDASPATMTSSSAPAGRPC